jgi:hypothetical protein
MGKESHPFIKPYMRKVSHLMKIGKWTPLPKENSQRSYIMDENIMKWAHSQGKATIELT